MSERGIPKDAAVYRALEHFDAKAYATAAPASAAPAAAAPDDGDATG